MEPGRQLPFHRDRPTTSLLVLMPYEPLCRIVKLLDMLPSRQCEIIDGPYTPESNVHYL